MGLYIREQSRTLYLLVDGCFQLNASDLRNATKQQNVRRRLQRSVQNCHAKYSVYVYPISSSLLERAEDARTNFRYHVCKKCIFEQFSLEYIIFDYFTQFCGRTYDPEKADFFYLPIIRDVDYRIALQNGGSRAPSAIDNALIEAIEKNDTSAWTNVFNVTDRYWHRRHGSDHIIVMPAPVTNLRHQSSMRGFFHYMIQLNFPIFINVELTKSFVAEYPQCSTKGKILVLPYPSTDPDLYNGNYHPIEQMRSQLEALLPNSNQHMDRLATSMMYNLSYVASLARNFLEKNPHLPRTKDKLLFYHGGMHGECTFIRQALVEIMQDNTITKQRGDKTRELGFATAKYCPIPIGDSPSSKRMYDVMNYGCVPVILSDELVWAYSKEVGGPLQTSLFALQFPQKIVQTSARQLLKDYAFHNFPILPSGMSIYSLLEAVAAEEEDESKQTYTLETGGNHRQAHTFATLDKTGRRTNTLVRVLERITSFDWQLLSQLTLLTASYFRYYELDKSMSLIPTHNHLLPNGGAIRLLDYMLETLLFEHGIDAARRACEIERNRKHRYVGNFPCEKQSAIIKKATSGLPTVAPRHRRLRHSRPRRTLWE